VHGFDSVSWQRWNSDSTTESIFYKEKAFLHGRITSHKYQETPQRRLLQRRISSKRQQQPQCGSPKRVTQTKQPSLQSIEQISMSGKVAFTIDEAVKEVNQSKNRYSNVLPGSCSRFMLCRLLFSRLISCCSILQSIPRE